MERGAFKLLSSMEGSWWYRGRAAAVRAAAARVAWRPAKSSLDFGAGFGGMHDTLAALSEQVYAFEPDAAAAQSCRGRGYAEVFENTDTALGRTYDMIALFDVLEHIERDVAFLIRARDALAPGRYLAITVPAFPFLWSAHDVNHHHFRRYTKTTLRAALESSGFSVEYMSYWNTALFIPAALMRLLGRTGEGSLAMPRALNAIFYAIVRTEAALMRASPLPLGTGLVAIARKK